MPMTMLPPVESAIEISGIRFSCSWPWDGRRLAGRRIAFDAETTLFEFPEIPELALAAASDGRRHVLIHPDDVADFIRLHRDREWIMQNCPFDFWVIHRFLSDRGDEDALAAWRRNLEERRIHDTLLLDLLLQLAGHRDVTGGKQETELVPRDLGEIAAVHLGLEIDKSNPYRLRFGEIIGRDWRQVDRGFFEYAMPDAIGTYLAYRVLEQHARRIMDENSHDPGRTDRFAIMPNAIERFGLLSEAIQVEGAIALEQISRNSMHVDVACAGATEEAYRRQLEEMVTVFRSDYPGYFKTDRQGNLKKTNGGGWQRSNKALDEYLLRAAEEIAAGGTGIEVPRSNRGAISHSTKKWNAHSGSHPFVGLWCGYEAKAKLAQFFASLRQPVIHPQYGVLKRTGRTGCSNPNVQQIPKRDEFRELFIASPGYLLLTIDYKYIELVLLAAVCEARFGHSRLAEVIRQGVDPHCFTAAMILGIPLEEFLSWEGDESEAEVGGKRQSRARHYKDARQLAKPINFGIPGGLSPRTLVGYAKEKYGVDMTLEQAEAFHHQLTRVIYPEIGLYLDDWGMARLAARLRINESICWDAFSWDGERSAATPKAIRKIVAGSAFKADGTPYNPQYVRRVWEKLVDLCRDPELRERLEPCRGSRELARDLFGDSVATLTGRVRAGVSYTEERNTGFQGTASDGAKRALGRLVLADYRVIGFIHDEILVELPDQGGYVELEYVERVISILREAMEEMSRGIPVSCEFALSTRWSKRAKLIIRHGRVYPWSPESVERPGDR
jgi:hypothetical protein